MNGHPTIAVWHSHPTDPRCRLIVTGQNLMPVLGKRPWAVLHQSIWYVLTDQWPEVLRLATRHELMLVCGDPPPPVPTPTPPQWESPTPPTQDQRDAAHLAYLETRRVYEQARHEHHDNHRKD